MQYIDGSSTRGHAARVTPHFVNVHGSVTANLARLTMLTAVGISSAQWNIIETTTKSHGSVFFLHPSKKEHRMMIQENPI